LLKEKSRVGTVPTPFANTQNKINQSDLLANTKFMSSLEHYSRTVWIPSQDKRKAETKWYFERARGQYMVDLNRRKRGKEQTEFKKEFPKELLLNKVDLAKNFMSWEASLTFQVKVEKKHSRSLWSRISLIGNTKKTVRINLKT
jgi:hypothetical protein